MIQSVNWLVSESVRKDFSHFLTFPFSLFLLVHSLVLRGRGFCNLSDVLSIEVHLKVLNV